MSELPKLCKDCVWINHKYMKIDMRTGQADPLQDFCDEPSNVNLVSGAPDPVDAFDMRDDKIGGRCGRDAKLFKPKS
jgi:hypothetical protein